jgi:hypothetical protein
MVMVVLAMLMSMVLPRSWEWYDGVDLLVCDREEGGVDSVHCGESNTSDIPYL